MQSSRVPLLILANLGLLPFVACKQEDSPPVVAPTGASPTTESTSTSTSTSTPTPTSTSTSTSTATPTSTSTSTATGTVSGAPNLSPPASAKTCMLDSDCGAAYLQCVHVAGVTDGGADGRCEHRRNYHLGRPLVIEGAARVAGYARAPSVTSAELDMLMRAATEEHASVAAFARTVTELMALGAPLSLLQKTQAALADEIRHTEMTLDLIEAATGERPVLGRLPAAVAPLRSGKSAAAELFVDVFRGGVIGETLAAAHAETQRAATTDDALHAFYTKIMHDEARHAALALETAQWLLAEEPALSSVLAEETRALAGEPFETRALVTPLLAVFG